MSKPVNISEEQFEKLAEVAAKGNCLKKRDGKYGIEFAVFLNGHLMAMATPTKSGEYLHFMIT
jgi:hypothetical protein